MQESMNYIIHTVKKEKYYSYINELHIIEEGLTISESVALVENAKKLKLEQIASIHGTEAIPRPEQLLLKKSLIQKFYNWLACTIAILATLQIIHYFLSIKLNQFHISAKQIVSSLAQEYIGPENEVKQKRLENFKKIMKELAPYLDEYDKIKQKK